MDYTKLDHEDMVIVDLEGNVIEGKWKPSTKLAMHCEIYKAREDVNAIVHIHPVYSSIFSVIKEDIPPIIEDLVMLLGDRIRVADYALPRGKELAANVVKALGKSNTVMLASHGSVCVGNDVERTLTACEVLEKSAQIRSGKSLIYACVLMHYPQHSLQHLCGPPALPDALSQHCARSTRIHGVPHILQCAAGICPVAPHDRYRHV
jgi:L-fuculose-phosphate aldolase